jgi:hypothetical protein
MISKRVRSSLSSKRDLLTEASSRKSAGLGLTEYKEMLANYKRLQDWLFEVKAERDAATRKAEALASENVQLREENRRLREQVPNGRPGQLS